MLFFVVAMIGVVAEVNLKNYHCVTVDELLFLRNCNLPLCHVTVSVGDYLLNNLCGSPWPFVGSLYNRYCL